MKLNLLSYEHFIDSSCNYMNSLYFMQCIKISTRFPIIYASSLFDKIWINYPMNCRSAVIAIDFTDHCLCFITYGTVTKKIINEHKNINFFPNNDEDRAVFTNDLTYFDWSSTSHDDEHCVKFVCVTLNHFFVIVFHLKLS